MAKCLNNVYFLLRPSSSLLSPITTKLATPQAVITSVRTISTTLCLNKNPMLKFKRPSYFLEYNDIVYPPQKEGEPPRPALRGKSVDEALKQLQFYPLDKGARICTELIEEALDLAVKEHNVEFRSNMWIEHLYVTKAHTIKGVRLMFRKQGIIHYRYSHVFIRLREGKPPKEYYKGKETGQEKLEEYLKKLRNRYVFRSL